MTELGCADVEARFVDAIDGRLDSADSVRFHAHIEGCPSCRERAALWRGLVPGMREAVPPAPGAMATRRMQIEIERRLAEGAAPAPVRTWRWSWAPALGLVAAAAAVVLWLRVGYQPPAPVGYAAIGGLRGSVAIGGELITTAVRVPVGTPIRVAAGASVEVALDSGAALVMEGPGLFILGGSARDVAVRLGEGKLRAAVEHRLPEQTFAVITKDLRVAVRGTKFAVDATAVGSRVEVTEGQVAVQFADGRSTLVSAGGSADSAVAAVEPDEDAPPAADDRFDHGDRAGLRGRRALLPDDGARGPDQHARRRLGARAPADRRCAAGAARRRPALRGERRRLRGRARLPPCGGAQPGGPIRRRRGGLPRAGSPGRPGGDAAERAVRGGADRAAAGAHGRRGRRLRARAGGGPARRAARGRAGRCDGERAGGGEGARARALATRYLRDFPHGLAAPVARRLADDGAP